RVAAGGPETLVINEGRAFVNPRFSPDGRHIAVEVSGAIWLYDLDGRTFTRLADGGGFAEWSGDGNRLVFPSQRDSKNTVSWQPADGSSSAELLYKAPDPIMEALLSPDAKWLIYRTGPDAAHRRDIFAVPLDGDRKPVLLVGGPAYESHPRPSPDG